MLLASPGAKLKRGVVEPFDLVAYKASVRNGLRFFLMRQA